MSEQQKNGYPQHWQTGDFDPNAHMMNLKGRDYLSVQDRLQWFIRDQRTLLVAGLATTTFSVETDLVEMDRQAGYAHFKTTVRDVLGNEATMYGSETARDFADFAEKASTKSLGRALLALGYGTTAAQELDEGERVVDAPQERLQPAPAQRPAPQRTTAAPVAPVPSTASTAASEPHSLDTNARRVLSGTEIQQLKRDALAVGVAWRDIVLWTPAALGRAVNALTVEDARRIRNLLADAPEAFASEPADADTETPMTAATPAY
ncbi:MAG: hypothetical protein IVW57_03170 [Ktedonobacterales bacterium]|nr:hypothetical protein [Ktedonobacterales bacterium]